MSTARYLIAKYIPDMFRNEPRNIGVVLWSDAGIRAKFWGSDDFGGIDKRRIPKFVSSKSAYSQWIETWYRIIKKPKIEYIGRSESELSTCSKSLDALITTSNGNYFLQNGGEVFQPVNADNVSDALNFLYQTLVDEEQEDGPETMTLDAACIRVIEQIDLKKDPNFKENAIVECPFGDVKKA